VRYDECLLLTTKLSFVGKLNELFLLYFILCEKRRIDLLAKAVFNTATIQTR